MHANSTPLSLDTPNTFGDVVVIFSVGRGGSGWFSQVVRNTDPQNKCTLETELFGGNLRDFKQKTEPPLSEMLTFFSKTRGKCPTGYIGFKWKLVGDSESGHSDTHHLALQYLALHHIPILYLTRNPLDTYISMQKYQVGELDRSHCTAADTKCTASHLATQVTLKNTSKLLRYLQASEKDQRAWAQRLSAVNATYTHVSYDTLAYGKKSQQVEILSRILKLMYPGDTDKLPSLDMLQTRYVATSDRSQEKEVTNYDEVVKFLTNTKFQSLLH